MDQPKIERMLRLMKMMSGNINYTVEELGDKLGISYRSIYRYIDTFKASGFVVKKLQKNIYKNCANSVWDATCSQSSRLLSHTRILMNFLTSLNRIFHSNRKLSYL